MRCAARVEVHPAAVRPISHRTFDATCTLVAQNADRAFFILARDIDSHRQDDGRRRLRRFIAGRRAGIALATSTETAGECASISAYASTRRSRNRGQARLHRHGGSRADGESCHTTDRAPGCRGLASLLGSFAMVFRVSAERLQIVLPWRRRVEARVVAAVEPLTG